MSLLPFHFTPPLFNSANPKATTLGDLAELYNSPYTGAITIRTSLLEGFPHDDAIHQYALFDASTGKVNGGSLEKATGKQATSSLNTLGYSPHPFSFYEDLLRTAASGRTAVLKPRKSKPIIVSVTGTPSSVAEMCRRLQTLQAEFPDTLTLLMELNLSCPNISGHPPPAYDEGALRRYLTILTFLSGPSGRSIHVGLKLPPFTYRTQFKMVVGLLGEVKTLDAVGTPGGRCPVTFLTSTNTLGSSLVFSEVDGEGEGRPALSSADGEGIGGMAGAAIHPLCLGNVRTLRRLLGESKEESVRDIRIIGVGGVSDASGYRRMRAAGADAVALATGMLRRGVGVFEEIVKGLEE